MQRAIACGISVRSWWVWCNIPLLIEPALKIKN
jgi:hypothetical protein